MARMDSRVGREGCVCESQVVSTSISRLAGDPGRLILQALADLEACERDARYRIDMSTWVVVDSCAGGGGAGGGGAGGLTCSVCFAGAVMAQRLGIGIGQARMRSILSPLLEKGFSDAEKNALIALDRFRRREWLSGILCFYEFDKGKVTSDQITALVDRLDLDFPRLDSKRNFYSGGPHSKKLWKRDMRRVANLMIAALAADKPAVAKPDYLPHADKTICEMVTA